MSNREVTEVVPSGYRMSKPVSKYCPDQLYELMCQCWKLDPIERPTFVHLHDFLWNFDISIERAYEPAAAAF